jgi:hypothetical protein
MVQQKQGRMKAYYFSNEQRKLAYDDGREIKVGETHTVDCKPILCQQGLHASKEPFDALQYASGSYLYEVELAGEIVEGDNKVVATSRTYVKEIDATELMRLFARQQALSVIHLWDAPDVVKEYLETGDEDLRAAAREAAWEAAWAAWAA